MELYRVQNMLISMLDTRHVYFKFLPRVHVSHPFQCCRVRVTYGMNMSLREASHHILLVTMDPGFVYPRAGSPTILVSMTNYLQHGILPPRGVPSPPLCSSPLSSPSEKYNSNDTGSSKNSRPREGFEVRSP